jgi:hypothetical protein
MKMKTLIPGIFAVLLSLSAISQDMVTETLMENAHDWREGIVTLNDGQQLSGLLRFDDHVGILSFQNGDVSKALIPRSCAKFELYDEEQRKQRFFYSLEYDDGKTFKKFYFFELLRSFDGFALLSKVDPIEVQNKTQGTGPFMTPDGRYYSSGGMYTTRTEVYQTETLYFMSEQGDIRPYVQIVEKDIETLFGDRKRSKNRFIDKDLLESYTGAYYGQVTAFAEKNGLSFKIKNDLLKILDAYAEMIQP